MRCSALADDSDMVTRYTWGKLEKAKLHEKGRCRYGKPGGGRNDRAWRDSVFVCARLGVGNGDLGTASDR